MRLLDLVAESSTPAVAVASGEPDKRICAIGIDDYRAAFEMTRHLISLGHQRIGFIIGHPNQTASARRLAGFRAAMAEAGLEVPDEAVAQGMFNYRSGLDAAEILLSHDPRPSAIFASNDDMAAAAGRHRPSPRPRRAGRPHGGGLRRCGARHHDLARAHHRAPADHRDGRRGGRPARAPDPRAPRRACHEPRAPRDGFLAHPPPVRRGPAPAPARRDREPNGIVRGPCVRSRDSSLRSRLPPRSRPPPSAAGRSRSQHINADERD